MTLTLKPSRRYSVATIALDILDAVDNDRATKNVTKNEYVELFEWRFLRPRLSYDQKAFLLPSKSTKPLKQSSHQSREILPILFPLLLLQSEMEERLMVSHFVLLPSGIEERAALMQAIRQSSP
jgi:hypothetical protein